MPSATWSSAADREVLGQALAHDQGVHVIADGGLTLSGG